MYRRGVKVVRVAKLDEVGGVGEEEGGLYSSDKHERCERTAMLVLRWSRLE